MGYEIDFQSYQIQTANIHFNVCNGLGWIAQKDLSAKLERTIKKVFKQKFFFNFQRPYDHAVVVLGCAIYSGMASRDLHDDDVNREDPGPGERESGGPWRGVKEEY